LIDGVVDIAIVGDNLLVEKERDSGKSKILFQM
jgi:ATP phosphoribosyltransferase